jgi:hypothetical protein
MASEYQSQPRYLLLTEVLANLALFVGVGFWVADSNGAWAGAAIISSRYAYLIWLATQEPEAEQPRQTPSDAEPGAAADRGNGN